MTLAFDLTKLKALARKPTRAKEAPSNTGAPPVRQAPKIRVVFMGTPHFASDILQALAEAGYNIVGVVTKPDKPVGREQATTESAVKTLATKLGLPVAQPAKLDAAAIETIRAWKPDLIAVTAYGKILPEDLLQLPGLGCLNVHASLLPRWRGASPIQNALLAGDRETGITIMLMDAGMDTGNILSQRALPIDPDETREALTAKLTATARELLLATLPAWVDRTVVPVPQDDAQATICQLIEREDGHIVWTDEAESLFNRYRALVPWPGVFTYWRKDDDLVRIKFHGLSFQKQSPQMNYAQGQVIELGEKIGVQTGSGVIFIEELQAEGKNRMPIDAFLKGNADFVGSILQ